MFKKLYEVSQQEEEILAVPEQQILMMVSHSLQLSVGKENSVEPAVDPALHHYRRLATASICARLDPLQFTEQDRSVQTVFS